MKRINKLITVLFLSLLCGLTIAPSFSIVATKAAESWWNSSLETTNACNYLVKNLGYTKFAAAGILGNFRHESNVNPYVRERIGNHYTYSLGKEKADLLDPDNNGFGPGWGIAQWGDGSGFGGLGSGRWIQLIDYTNKKKGTQYTATYNDSFRYGVTSNEASLRANIPSLYEQLDFVLFEMRPNSGYVSQHELNRMRTLEETSDAVLYRYEKSSTKTQDKRRQNTYDIYYNNCAGVPGNNFIFANGGTIDELSTNGNTLKVKGWHATEMATENTKRYLLLFDANTDLEVKRLPITGIIRLDVVQTFPSPTSRMSGFDVEIPIEPQMRGKTLYVVTRYLAGNNPDKSVADGVFRPVQIRIPHYPTVNYQAKVQKLGWQSYVKDGKTAGTVGKSLTMEGLRINVSNLPVSGGVTYVTQVQRYGWQKPVSNDQVAGTAEGLRLEGVRIVLTGELAKQYDIYYRTQIQRYGWLGWAKNGGASGSEGRSLRMEAIEIKLVPKNEKAPQVGKAFVLKDGIIR